MAKTTGILYIGDLIGSPGRDALKSLLPVLLSRMEVDLVIANGENSAGGFGITPAIFEELKTLGVDVVTTGNHVWDKREILDYIGTTETLLRPANYPEGSPGAGSVVVSCGNGVKVGVVNLAGRVFMDDLDCPFRVGGELVKSLLTETPLIIVDMHAEATSEKVATGWYLDGIASAVIGSHTHVQTSDERVLPGGTAYITDAGMTGPVNSVIGVDKDIIIDRFLNQMPKRFEVAGGPVELQGVFVKVGPDGRAVSIERVKEGVG